MSYNAEAWESKGDAYSHSKKVEHRQEAVEYYSRALELRHKDDLHNCEIFSKKG
jgi:hypothetical protein